MDLIAYLEKEASIANAEMDAVMKEADGELRAMNDEEMARFKSAHERREDYREKAQAERDRRVMRAQIEADTGILGEINDQPLAGEFSNLSRPIGKTLGEQYVASGQFKMLAERAKSGRITEGMRTEVVSLPWGSKAATSPVLESGNAELFGNMTTTAGALTTVVPGVFDAGFRLLPPAIADLLPTIPVSTNTVTLITISDKTQLKDLLTLTGSSWGTAENTTKQVIGYDTATSVAVLRTLAGYTKMSVQFFEDAPAVVSYINNDLPMQVRQAEDKYLAGVLYASVSDASALTGSTTSFDQIQSAITVIQAAGFNPNAMLITPTNWGELSVEKYGTGAGDKQYVGGGPFGANPNNLWNGLRVIVTPFATADHPLIGDFSGARLYRNGGVNVATTNSDQDDFVKNLMTIRVETRLVANKQYPEAFKTANLA